MSAVSILIVEDEAMTAMFMESMLRKRGYNVLKCVSTGEEAIDSAVMLSPDLIVMDIRLAGKMDGIEAAAGIREKSSKSSRYIFTTGYSDVEIKELAAEFEPLAFLIKPVNLSEMARIIDLFFKSD